MSNPSCTPHTALGVGCSGTDTIPIYNTPFTFDAVGNRAIYGDTYNYSDEGNRLNGQNSNGARFAYQYDYDGNLTQRYDSATTWRQNLYWSSLGQLDSVVTMSNDTVRVAFGYDAFGQRVRRTVNGTSVGFVLRDDNVSLVLNASGAPVEEYSYWGLDQPLMMRKSDTTYVFAADPMGGSVRGLIRKSDNAVVAYYDYSPQGYTVGASYDSIGNRFRFAGREYDSETKLYYNRARYLDPAVGRFVTEDPIGVNGGLNLYAYASNDPVNLNDATGLLPRVQKLGAVTATAHRCPRNSPFEQWWMCDLDPDDEPEAAGPQDPPQPHGGGAGRPSRKPAFAFLACVANASSENRQAMKDGIDRAFGMVTPVAEYAIGKVMGSLGSTGLANMGYATSSTFTLSWRYALGKSAGVSELNRVFGQAAVQGIKIGVTSEGMALSGSAVLLGAATNVGVSVAISGAYYAGAWLGSIGTGIGSCM